MKLPCEMIVSHVLPVARGSISRDLVDRHGMTQVQVAKKFGVTSAAVSQYLKGIRGGDHIINRSMYKDDFHEVIRRISDRIAAGDDVSECLCMVCAFTKESGLLKALYVNDGYRGEDIECLECPRLNIVIPK